MKTYLAYHMEHENGPFPGNEFFTDKIINKVADCFVVSSVKPGKSGKVIYRLEGKYRIRDVIQNTTDKFPEKDWHLQLAPLFKPATPITLDGNAGFDRKLFHNNFTSGAGLKEMKNGMESFSDLFDALVGANEDQQTIELLRDLDEIDEGTDSDDGPTEREDNRKSRIGQGKFRRNTIHTWGDVEKCAVTGIAISALLSASHIIPWREDIHQRKRGCNGILLAAHLDRLFDRFLIGFQRTPNQDIFGLIAAPCLKNEFPVLAAIGISTRSMLDLTMVKFSDRPKLEANLRWHLDQVLANI